MDSELVAWYREYRFRRAFSATHEQYLDESSESVSWLLAVHDIFP